ncbi:MAG: cytochrome c family protein [Spirochaetes bacterium]|nr:cytochrome c family protein [Spirochaetota bacterium]
MMKSGRIIFITIILFFWGLYLTGSLFSLEDKVLIVKTGHRKPQILFNHKSHSEDYVTKCSECHHREGDLKDKSYRKCQECHKERDQGHVINLKGAFHQQCHDCHRKTSGPKACGRCHKN